MNAPTIWRGPTDRSPAMRRAATEYERFHELISGLTPDDWTKPTVCPAWDVRAMAAHALGMTEMSASLPEMIRQNRKAATRAKNTGELLIDALTGLQVDERATMSPDAIVDRFGRRGPKAAAFRRRTPTFVRRRTMPDLQRVGDTDEAWTFGFLIDTILTRDPWMHRADIVAATGAPHRLTADHDGALVADVVAEWAIRHGEPYDVVLTGPAGGHWSSGSAETVEMDAVDFCRALSGRGATPGLLATAVPF